MQLRRSGGGLCCCHSRGRIPGARDVALQRVQPGLLYCDGFRETLHQRTQLTNLGREGIGERTGLVERCIKLAFQSSQPPSHLRDLARNIGAAARQVSELTIHDRSKADPAGYETVENKSNESGGWGRGPPR